MLVVDRYALEVTPHWLVVVCATIRIQLGKRNSDHDPEHAPEEYKGCDCEKVGRIDWRNMAARDEHADHGPVEDEVAVLVSETVQGHVRHMGRASTLVPWQM
jgi:hypothetical protein